MPSFRASLDKLIELGKRQLKSRISKPKQVLIKNLIWNARRIFREPAPESSKCPEHFFPKISIVVPVFNSFDYLKQCIDSLVTQDYPAIEIVLVDDLSTDPRVVPLLRDYNRNSRVKMVCHLNNRGISAALNSGVLASSGEYVGFVDCDDFLPPNAVAKMSEHIRENFGRLYYFSNRINWNVEENQNEKISFANKPHADYRKELLMGMFADHLKVFDRRLFVEVGLLRSEWDAVQDYEFALRTAFLWLGSFQYINDYLYVHRVYPQQISRSRKAEQDHLAVQLQDKYRDLGAAVISGEKMISIVILSFNKIEHTTRCIDQIKKTTEGRYEIILFDNGSSGDTQAKLLSVFEKDPKVKLHLHPKNLGCPRGRMEAIGLAGGDYVFTLDNDILVSAGWEMKLVERIQQSGMIGAACCKVVFPDDSIQFTGGFCETESIFIKFGLHDQGRKFDALASMVERDCDWVPGGATMYRREVFENARISDEFFNNYEDNDFSLQLRNHGWRLVSCPSSRVLHNHVYFDAASRRDSEYMGERYGRNGIARSAMAFYRRNGLIIKDYFALGALGLAGRSDDEIIDFFKRSVKITGDAPPMAECVTPPSSAEY